MNHAVLTAREQSFCRYFVSLSNGREAAARAGYLLFPERQAQKILQKSAAVKEIERLRKKAAATESEVIAGFRRLAFGSAADAVRLLLADTTGEALNVEELDLFTVADIKKPKGGGMEIKFFDRQKALEQLYALSRGDSQNTAVPFYEALENSAKALRGADE